MPSRPPKAKMPKASDTAGRRGISIDGKRLTVEQVVAVARDQALVRVMADGRTRAAEAHKTMIRAVKSRPVYGQSTGVGSNKDAPVPDGAVADHGVRLLESHAASIGPSVSPELARAMMVVRLNQLAAGGSGVHPRLLDALATALNRGLTPPLNRYGAIGTGDLTALATTALCIMGKKPWVGGTMTPYQFENSDALAFMSSNAATLGEAVLAGNNIVRRLHAGLIVAALTYLAMDGSSEAYDAKVHEGRPHTGQLAAAAEMRMLLDADLGRTARRIQDPYGLRALPQVQGAAFDAAEQLRRVLGVEINAASENPLVSGKTGEIYHNGNFHSVYTNLALDTLRAALFSAASLSVARTAGLMTPSNTGLRPFLADGPAASSGVLIIEYIAHSALAELRHLALPDNLGSAVLSHGTEEHASFATQSAWHATNAVPVYDTILACELLAAVYALRQQKIRPSGPYLRDAYEAAATALGQEPVDASIGAILPSLEEFIRQLSPL